MKGPRFLIIMPAYNAEKTIIPAIESIIHQEYVNWELIIIDDGSTDNTYSLAIQYNEFPNINIVQNQQNQGCYYSRNLGLYYNKYKEWDYFTIHDSDDTSSPDRLKIYAQYINTQPELKYIYSAGEGDRWTSSNTKQFISKSKWVGQSFISRKLFENIGYFDYTRFGGDAEYEFRATISIASEYNLSLVNSHVLLSYGDFGKLTSKYNYTYKFRATSSNLTFIYDKQKRKEYQDEYEIKFNPPNAKSLKRDFTPLKNG